MHSKKREPSIHGWPDQQILVNVSATLQHLYFNQQNEKILQAFQKLEFFKFFCWLEYYWCLFSEAPTQLAMMSDDTLRLVYVYMLLLR